MRILFLTPYPAYPARGGGMQRMYQFMRGLSERHELWCLSLSPSPQASAAAAPLAELCHLALFPAPQRSLLGRAIQTLTRLRPDMALRAPSPQLAAALDALTSEVRFDVVQAESLEMAQYAMQVRRRGMLTVLDEFNAEYVLQRRAALTDLRDRDRLHAGIYSLIQWRKLTLYERRVSRALDRVLVVSQNDRQALRKLSRRIRPIVVPNGVDTAFFSPGPAHSAGDCLLFTGTMDFRPNIDAVRWFVGQVLPLVRDRRAAYLRIVGRAPSSAVLALAQPAIVDVVGEVDDIRESFADAAVYVVPMRMGGGVRLKVLEAMAMAMPVVSTSMGVDGIEGLRPGVHCLVADTAQAFADAVVRLLEDRELASRLGAAGQQFVRERYDWGSIVPLLEKAYA